MYSEFDKKNLMHLTIALFIQVKLEMENINCIGRYKYIETLILSLNILFFLRIFIICKVFFMIPFC